MTTDSGTHGVRGLCSNRGSSRFGLLVVCLAAILVGAFAQAGHAQSVTLGGGTMRVFGTGGDDVIFFITFDIAAGSLFPGQDGEEGPPVIPALAPLPESDITVLFTVINGLIFPPAPAGFAPPATQAQWDALKAEVEGLPTKDDIKLIIVRADDGDDVVDCSELAGDMAIETELYGEAGNDRLLGGEKNDIIDGGSGDDVLMGGKGDDEILGGAGNDILRGFEGADTLNGGGGFDLLDYALDGGARAINVNLPAGTATDGWGGADKVEGFAAIRARGTNDTLIGNANDSTTILGGAGNDTITGGTDRDVLFGEDGNDVIRGGNEEGAGDFIFGGAGNDELFSGEGQDTINGDGNPPPAWDTGVFVAVGDPLEPLTAITVDDIVGVAPTIPDGGGNDKIYGGMDADLIYGGGGSDIIWGDQQDDPAARQHGDTIYGDYGDPTSLQGGGDEIHGGGGSDRIYGGAGGDTIYGDGGADTIQGNAGSDSIYGGQLILPSGGYIDDNMADTVDYSDAPAGVSVTLPPMGDSSTALDGYGGSDMLNGIEHLRGSQFDDYLIGSDILTVGNIIEGLGGNDVILGGRGDDFLYGGGGDDYIWGDGGDQYQGGNDTIDGGSGNNELHGEGGDDIFMLAVLGAGNNAIYGGAGRDTLDYSGARDSGGGVGVIADFTVSPVVINHFAPISLLPLITQAAVDTVYNCDNLGPPSPPENGSPTTGPGVPLPYINCAAAENTFISRVEVIQGSSFADTITGYASLSMEIRGGAGNDTLTGGSANDLVYGEAGDDLIEGLGGDDYLDGGANSTVGDTVTYAHAPAGVKVTLGLSSAQNTVAAGFDILTGFENLTGSAFNDTLTGDANPNTISGLAGDDVLNGRGDKDVVVGGITLLSQDTLDGGAGTDTADYRQGTPPLNPPPNPAGGVALDDGEGGSDVLISIESALLPAGALFVSAGADKAIKPGGSTVLDGIATGGYGNYSYVWDTVPPITPDPGKLQDDCSLTVPGLNTRCIAKPTATPAATTVYRLTVTDTPPGGGQALVSSAFVQVVVASALTVSAGPDATISLGQTAQLTGAISGGVAPYTVLWSPSAGVSKIDALLTTASPNATTLYTLTVTDQVGQQASDTMTVTVLNPFTVDAGADVSITQGQSTLLNATVVGGTPPFVYQWSPPDGLLSTTIPNPECRAFVTTTYVVTVTDSTGRVVVDSVKVTVLPAGGSSGDGGQGNGSQTGDGSGTGNGGTGGTGGSGTTDTPTVRPIFPCGFGVSQSLVFGCLLFLGLACGRRVRSWSR